MHEILDDKMFNLPRFMLRVIKSCAAAGTKQNFLPYGRLLNLIFKRMGVKLEKYKSAKEKGFEPITHFTVGRMGIS